jgi:hypothetical protein
MEWKGILFFVWLALFTAWGIFTVNRLAEWIIKKYGEIIYKFLEKHSSSPIVRHIFKVPDQSENEVNKQYDEEAKNKPICPRVFVEPICNNGEYNDETDKADYHKPSQVTPSSPSHKRSIGRSKEGVNQKQTKPFYFPPTRPKMFHL